MAKNLVKYAVIDAFTSTAFKGNPAAVCFLEKDDENRVGDEWMQSVAAEFNISETAFLTRIPDSGTKFNLRWFTPVAEVDLCGHATIAAAHFLFTSSMAKGESIEFATKSGILTAKKIDSSIELNFPVVLVEGCDPSELPMIPSTLNGSSMISVSKTFHNSGMGDLIVEVSSGEDVVNLRPDFKEISKCAGRGIIVTAPAPAGSGFDMFSRFFCPKMGIDEDPVCGSAHCALAPYWSAKLGNKKSLVAYMASPRGGRLDLELEEETQRVRIRGEAVTVMVGTLLV